MDRIQKNIQGFSQDDFGSKLILWHQHHRMNHPWRQKFANTHDPYVIWVAEIMLQQTTIQCVLPKYSHFIARFPTLSDLAAATEAEVLSYTASLGYYRRFRTLYQTAKSLVEKQRSLPKSYGELLKLGGIGPYTAASIASICFGESVPAIDGNVKRVMCRLLDLRLDIEDPFFAAPLTKLLRTVMTPLPSGLFNEALMELGQTICTSRKDPICSECPLCDVCLARQNNQVVSNPKKRRKKTKKDLFLKVHIHTHQGKLLLVHRPQDFPVLKNSYGFPLELITQPSPPRLGHHLGCFSHAITQYKITLDVMLHQNDCYQRQHHQGGSWHGRHDLEKALVSSLDLKAWQLYHNHRSSRAQQKNR
ncbi:MAG: A/G-specific adenine glycosylase [Proteobacteria bacterium]|nr:A/G-specific adenine glycosylase [Pseudomonadota bacterium]